MKQTKEFFADKLCEIFPDKKKALDEHYRDYGELLGHIFFSEEICPLYEMLIGNEDTCTIKKYCAFIEDMWANGTDDVVNVVDVTVLERLSDDETVWKNFGKYISNDFIRYINTEELKENCMMSGVPALRYN